MNFLLQVFVVCLFVNIAESANRVPRDIGYNCPRDIDFPKGMNCRKCVKYRRRGSKVTLRCPSGFSRYGNKRLICGKDGLWKGDLPLCVKPGCSPIHTSNDLNLVMSEHPKFSDAVITFQCEADSIMFGPTEIHCDGVNWSSPPPRCAAIEDLLSCDFEEDLCGWTQDSTVIGNQNWTRGIGPTMTGGTGPKRDHTLPNSDTGHYMYLETSAPTKEGDKAVLVSPMYTADFSPMCFEFWYHMLGPDDYGHVGSIDVYIKAESDQFAFLQPEFHKEGNQGDTWHKGDIFIDDQIESYQILIVATKMKSYMSDVAIDDVRLYNCTKTTPSTTTTTTLQTTTTKFQTTQTPTPSPTVVSSELSTRQNISISTQYIDVSTVITNASQTSGVVISTELPQNRTDIVGNSTSVVTTVPTVGSTVVNSSEAITKSSLSTSKSSTLGLKSTIPASSPVTTKASTTSSPKQSTAKVPVQSTTTSAPLSSSSAKLSTTSRPTTSTTIIPTVISTSKATAITSTFTTKSTTSSAPQTTVVPTTSTPIPTTRTSSTRPPTVKTTQTEFTTSPTVRTSSAKTRQTQISTDALSTTAGFTTTTTVQTTPTLSKTTSNVPPVSSTVQTSPQTSIQAATGLSTKSSKSSTQNTTDIVKTTEKAIDKTNKEPDNNATAKAAISKHPEDDTLKPLMIGLGVGIIVGLVIIGIIVWACMRRRKFYTRGYEDELKPITNAASTQSLNNVEYYQDDFDIEHIQ